MPIILSFIKQLHKYTHITVIIVMLYIFVNVFFVYPYHISLQFDYDLNNYFIAPPLTAIVTI